MWIQVLSRRVVLVWREYWKLDHDPFLDPRSPFVPTSTHAEAVARLAHAIDSGERLAVVRAGAGLGKTRVLRELLAETRSPTRRSAVVASPGDGVTLLAGLAEALDAPISNGLSRADVWWALRDAVEVCQRLHLHVILAVDGCQDLTTREDRHDLERLVHLIPDSSARLTVLQLTRSSTVDDDTPSWGLGVRLRPLTRGDVERYISTKLTAAGRDEPTFTPRAIHRLHAGSAGVPRAVDRLASLALIAGALRGLEMITPDLVDGVAHEVESWVNWG